MKSYRCERTRQTPQAAWVRSMFLLLLIAAAATPAMAGFTGDGKTTPASSNEHRVEFTVGGVIQADTTYFFKVTHSDPAGVRPDLPTSRHRIRRSSLARRPSGTSSSMPGVDRARILWDANVIGIGHIDYGIASPDELSVEDQENVTSHSIELTGLTPGTTYQYRVNNVHAIDGGSLAAKKLNEAQAQQLTAAANDIRTQIGC